MSEGQSPRNGDGTWKEPSLVAGLVENEQFRTLHAKDLTV